MYPSYKPRVSIHRSELVELRLRELISAGEIPRGTHLREIKLAALMEIGRTPVRQALERLAVEGLICSLDGGGFVVGDGESGPSDGVEDQRSSIESIVEQIVPLAPGLEVFAAIEREIVLLAALGSWRINASALGEAYELNRTSVEEILAALQVVGLVTPYKQTRWTVVHLNEVRMDQVFQVRWWLESNLLAESVVSIPIQVLESAIDSHQRVLDRYPEVSGAELDVLELQMHHELLGYANNAVGRNALSTAQASLIFSKHVLGTDEIPLGKEEPFIAEHLSILEAVRRRDSEECRLRLQAHLMKSRSKLQDRLVQFRKRSTFNPPEYVKPLGMD